VVGAAALTVGVALSCSACTVPHGSVMGVGVDDAGRLVGYLRVCHDHIDGATIYLPTDGFNGKTVGEWSASQPVTDYASWSLVEPTDGWTTELALPKLKAGMDYQFYGGTNENTWSAMGSDFTKADVDSMQPGMVWYSAALTDRATGAVTWSHVQVTVDEFKSNACNTLAAAGG